MIVPDRGSSGTPTTTAFVETGKQPELFFLVAFLLTFGFVRTSTHMIRAQVSWWPGNVEVGGTHVHHLVFGIIIILVVGYDRDRDPAPDPWREILAVLFGIGAGADARRVRALAQPQGRLLGEGGPALDRRGDRRGDAGGDRDPRLPGSGSTSRTASRPASSRSSARPEEST